MSHLSIFSGPVSEEPHIYSFLQYVNELRQAAEDTQEREVICLKIDERARTEFKNRNCPHCKRVTVDPVELRDGQLGRNGAIIPGTGTLVGFSCNACGHEWPTQERAKRITI